MAWRDPHQRALVIAHFEAGELEPMGRRDDDDAVLRQDITPFDELIQCRQGHSCLGAAIQTGSIRARGGIGQLVLSSLFDDPLEGTEHLYSPFVAYRRPNLDCGGERFLCRHFTIFAKTGEIAEIERVRVRGLGAGDAWEPVDQSQLAHHQQTFAQGAHVAQVSCGNDDPVWDLPVELLDNLDADRLLSLHAQRIHRVGQVDGLVGGHLLHDAHAAIKVGIQRQNQSAVGQGLDQLGCGDLAPGEKDNSWNARRSRIGGYCSRGVASGCAGHSPDRAAVGHHLTHD